ncbi:uncharacterized protein LACBIDRAFT_326590 [Laccaria bicolor S238N-H82]|uniref:Predicted protein n=1 Tax=Laccaria bicolor (strain S238N-H82 / ATCC MYA-4686) TaxID=486041 RepID=B0D951_LACBS|nr:uncharacterized protein LACBIDRAFT_326590 [Laccaria bicolor S238N-H82]EDR08950.1 predicted protein [Laccaria bicolor S238N-H82]|eukprot:XP_001880263.1 predicted protein [Laccaria bicolor S238N-H82]
MTIGDGASPPKLLSDGRNSELASSDGLGGTEPNPGPGPRYIYYRLYAQDGPIKSNNPIYSNNAFISRVMPRSVAPPHTAASLKKHLCKVEGFSAAPESCALYLSLSEKVPVDGAARLSFRGDLGPGSSSLDPLALVVGSQESGKRSPASNKTGALDQWVGDQVQTRFVHYRVYDESGEVTSKTSFDKDDTSLGRINILSVSPPHTVASLKACIAKAEGMTDHDLQTFEDDMGEIIMKDDDTITIITDVYPGILQDAPIAIVFGSKKATRVDRAFTKRIQIIYPSGTWASPDPKWHSMKDKEILQTDGALRSELYTYKCYMAINSEGKKALVAECEVLSARHVGV